MAKSSEKIGPRRIDVRLPIRPPLHPAPLLAPSHRQEKSSTSPFLEKVKKACVGGDGHSEKETQLKAKAVDSP